MTPTVDLHALLDSAVACRPRGIQLGGRQVRFRALHLDVKLRRPPGVAAGPDGLEPDGANGFQIECSAAPI